MSSHEQAAAPTSAEDAALAAPPDAQNPALIDARKTFILIMLGCAAFIGVVFVFIL
jgi:hypothetical protein